jgi:hypothetical protein
MTSSNESTQNIPKDVTKLKKLSKVKSCYLEIELFKDSNHRIGYFCYNCIYFMKPNHCSIVTDEGPDVHGEASGKISRHEICALWKPNEKEMR